MPASSHREARPGLRAWWLARDPHGLAFVRGLRGMIVGGSCFAVIAVGLDNPTMGLTAAFAGISGPIFADYGGTDRERSSAYLNAGWVGALLIALGTAVSDVEWAAIVLAFVVAAAVRFVGNLSPRLNASVSLLILAFVLGVLVPAPDSAIPDRMIGWAIGTAGTILITTAIRSRRTSERLDEVVARGARSLAEGLRAAASTDGGVRAASRTRVGAIRAELAALNHLPLRPSGPGLTTVARRTMVDRLIRLAAILDRELAATPVRLSDDVLVLGENDARMLDTAAGVLDRTTPAAALEACFAAHREIRATAIGAVVELVEQGTPPAEVVSRVDGGFALRAGGVHAEAFARAACIVVHAPDVAESVMPDAHVVPEASARGSVRRTERFVVAHAQPTSVWFRDAARAGLALALAVWVAETFVDAHPFWVALGTISVLRSSALATGQTAVGAAVGTGLGFAISSALFAALGLEHWVLWVVFFVAVWGIGALPPVLGFASGQAAFSVAMVVMFNLIEPVGWHTGLLRFENVGLGALVATVVAFIFWPRRLVPLVERLAGEFGRAAGALLVATVRGRSGPQPPDLSEARRVADRAETQVRAALAELTNQYRHAPELVGLWTGRVGVAAHGRSVSGIVDQLRQRLPHGTVPTVLDPALDDAAALLAHDLGDVMGDPPARRERMEQTLRVTAERSVAEDAAHADAVVSSLFTRDWLLTLAALVDERG